MELRLLMALQGGAAQPFVGLGFGVAGTEAAAIGHAQLVFGLRIALFGERPPLRTLYLRGIETGGRGLFRAASKVSAAAEQQGGRQADDGDPYAHVSPSAVFHSLAQARASGHDRLAHKICALFYIGPSGEETTISYSLLRALLFRLEPETAHHLALEALKAAARLRLVSGRQVSAPRTVMGIAFPNPVGLAAGLDKNGDYIDALAALGFGFIEVGTVTPRPQPGNPKPRLFRLPRAQAIINRMGFNNQGVDYLLANVRRARYRGVLGINIGKNFDTPVERAVDDYVIGLRKVYAYASYVAVNISSPNTPNLRHLQEHDALLALLRTLKAEQQQLAQQHGKYVPLAVKIAPDLSAAAVADIAAILRDQGIDAVIATNTTLARDVVAHLPQGNEAGGLSGAPLTGRATEVVHQLHAVLQGDVPIIAVGGIMTAADAVAKARAGASLVQLYSGFIYRGPALITEVAQALAE